jgi:uncharacterized protein (DUF2062 family)
MTILKRRHPRTRGQHIREALWPSMGLMRLGHYYKHRIGRLPGTPYYITAGFATGVAISFTPFVGFHLMVAGFITWILGGSLVAMALGTLISGNPWTFPFIWLSSYKLGQMMMGHESTKAARMLHHQFTFNDLLQKPMELLLPMILGSIPLAVASWCITYYIVADIVKRQKDARVRRIHGEHHRAPPSPHHD